MAKNPYHDARRLADLLWEAEMIADRYSNGGLLFVRTKDGWRAFFGDFENDGFRNFEKALDKNVPAFGKGWPFEPQRNQILTDEIIKLLIDCGFTRDYYPEKFRYELEEDLED